MWDNNSPVPRRSLHMKIAEPFSEKLRERVWGQLGIVDIIALTTTTSYVHCLYHQQTFNM